MPRWLRTGLEVFQRCIVLFMFQSGLTKRNTMLVIVNLAFSLSQTFADPQGFPAIDDSEQSWPHHQHCLERWALWRVQAGRLQHVQVCGSGHS